MHGDSLFTSQKVLYSKYMNTPISKEWTGSLIVVLVSAAPFFGFEVVDQASLANAVIAIAGFAVLVFRISRGDIHWFGLRKN